MRCPIAICRQDDSATQMVGTQAKIVPKLGMRIKKEGNVSNYKTTISFWNQKTLCTSRLSTGTKK